MIQLSVLMIDFWVVGGLLIMDFHCIVLPSASALLIFLLLQ